MKPLYIWAGGKGKMLKHYQNIFPDRIEKYIEPFFGGGAVFVYIMKTYNPKVSYINDINPDIVEIYKSIKTYHKEFIKEIQLLEQKYIPLEIKDRKKFYYSIREKYAWEYSTWNKVKESAVLYFLMKTSFNGIYQVNKNTNNRYGTPSGLLNQTSLFDYSNITEWNQCLQNVNISSGDWKDCFSGDGFFFMDPPYRDSFADYANPFSDEALLKLIDFCQDKSDVMICNRDSGDSFFEKYKGNLELKSFPITYTAGRRKKVDKGFEAKQATEILLYKTSKRSVLDFNCGR